jgi:diaminopimelate epimerase
MEIEFLKMQGCGEDTLLVDCFKQQKPRAENCPELARRILDRRCGVGADSLLLLSEGAQSRLAAQCFDARGEEAPVSMNAVRCAARYASDSGIAVDKRFTVETGAGLVASQIIDSSNVRVDLGVPARVGGGELREKPLESFTKTIVADNKHVTFTPVSLTSSFVIVFVTLFDFSFPHEARAIAASPEFPQNTGICFTQVHNREKIRLRVWEPGAARGGKNAEDKSSCAGAAAAVVASVVNGFTDREVFVHCEGGDFFVQWEERDNRLYLTGPAYYVFTGTYYFEEQEA